LFREEAHSDTEILASPRKRQKFFKEDPKPKKSLLDEMKSKTSETFRYARVVMGNPSFLNTKVKGTGYLISNEMDQAKSGRI
jgi:hypothetical protein